MILPFVWIAFGRVLSRNEMYLQIFRNILYICKL